MEEIRNIMHKIVSCVSSNIETADTRELGEAIDMIKDLSTAQYYCSIVSAMEDSKYGIDYDVEGRIRKGYVDTPTPLYGANVHSRYDKARKGYSDMHDMSSLNMLFDVIEEDMCELKPSMSATDMQTAKQRLITLANMM